MSGETTAVTLREAARRCGLSYRTARRKVAEGTFPVPELPRIQPRDWHRYSTADIDAYLHSAATDDARRMVAR